MIGLLRKLSFGIPAATPEKQPPVEISDDDVSDYTVDDNTFNRASTTIKEISGIGNNDKLQLYALYKQATVGDINTERPKNVILDYVGGAKWDAWSKLQGTTTKLAAYKYVDLVRQYTPVEDMNKMVSDISFSEAVSRVKLVDPPPSQEVRLQLYGLYKQTTVGVCNTPRPGMFELVDQKKWNSWTQYADMTKQTAEEKYIKLVLSLNPPQLQSETVTFDDSVKRLKLVSTEPSQEVRLKLYGLYKRSTVGVCNTTKPGMFDLVGQKKWMEWNKYSNISKTDAENQYVETVMKLNPPPLPVGEEPKVEEYVPKTLTVEEIFEDSTRPTPEHIKNRRDAAYKLAYGRERLAAFDGTPPLEKFCSPAEVLIWRAAKHPKRHAFTSLKNGEIEDVSLNYNQLLTKSQSIAQGLSSHGVKKGDRVLLLYPQNLEFVTSFFGCLMMGAVAVPSYPPHPARLARLLPRLLGIIEDCKPTAIATTKEIKEMANVLSDQIPQLASIPLVATDEIQPSLAAEWTQIDLKKDDIAFLQYTSGSTSAPKGVMVSHFNLIYNLEIFRVAGEMDENEVGVSWCPEFHDLGLIAGILCPVYLGFPLYLMSPELFLQKPYRWVKAMTKYKGTFSGGPNFAYDLTARKCTKEEKEQCDLSSWRIAFCGAEPVKMATARRFHAEFPSFRQTTFYPGYGLAESTLIIANNFAQSRPSHFLAKTADLLENGVAVEANTTDIESDKYRSIVSQGWSWLDNTIQIVNTTTGLSLPPNHVGEIWVKGPTVAHGYWGKPEITNDIFGGVLPGDDTSNLIGLRGKYLKTGDLGFMTTDGEIFITGRCKDVIIVNGVNIYPHDLEWTTESTDKSFKPGSVAAFAIDDETSSEQQVIIAQEIDDAFSKAPDLSDKCKLAVDTVYKVHGIKVSQMILLSRGNICKTTSGKIQRNATRIAFCSGELESFTLFHWKQHYNDEVKHLPTDPTEARKFSHRPTPVALAKLKAQSMELAYSKERLAAFDGTPPLEKFCSPAEVLIWRAAKHPKRHAFTSLKNGEIEDVSLNYNQLLTKSQSIAQGLSSHGVKKGDRVLLLYPQNLEFVTSFFGCLMMGAVAVPSYPPHPARLARLLPRLLGIIEDCKPTAIATTKEIKEMAQVLADQIPQLASIPLVATDELSANLASDWNQVSVAADDIAFLQYTSGSTSAPKGVMVTHFNLLFNLETFRVAGEMDENEVGVSWCPEFHDLGLIAGILCPVYLGFPLYLMSPELFLQKPYRWVKAMTKYKGTFSGGPNFAYDLTARKCTKEEKEQCDLSSWRIAFCGAEPVKISTAKHFCREFPSFKSSTFYPGYGLAESTLIIANKCVRMEPTQILLNSESLSRGKVVDATDEDIKTSKYSSIVSQGVKWLDNDVRCVDPETFIEVPPYSVGEIIVSGPTVASGYWNNKTTTEEIFQNILDGKRFLRTGDLGFILPGGEVFICGRSKDIININGVKYYPQDFEATAETVSNVLRKGCSAAFESTESGNYIIICEVDQDRVSTASVNLSTLAKDISHHLCVIHGIAPIEVILIPARSICKTSSGKIQRNASKEEYKLLCEKDSNCSWELLAKYTTNIELKESTSLVPPLHPGKPLRNVCSKNVSSQLRVMLDSDDVDCETVFFTPQVSPAATPRPVVSAGGKKTLSSQLAVTHFDDELICRSPPTITTSAISERVEALVTKPISEMVSEKELHPPSDIAIVGIGCRVASADTPDQFWDLLKTGKGTNLREVPPGRPEWDDSEGPNFKLGSFLSNEKVMKFDNNVFGMSLEEASCTDPQHRMLLEVTHEALLDAAITPDMLSKGSSKTGVFVGISHSEYQQICSEKAPFVGIEHNSKSNASAQIAKFLQVTGPVRSVDTACSSSLVAVHEACAAVRDGDCEHAVVGGVNLMLTPEASNSFKNSNFLSETGKCNTFDNSANGYCRSEGAGMIVIKKLSKAISDNDRIYSVIRGSNINQDGKTNGITAPNQTSQRNCIKQALLNASTDSSAIQYIEAHGTGTPLGDPIELEAIKSVFGEQHLSSGNFRIGSVKSNTGHAEAAAGITGLIKVCLSLYNRKLPPSVNYKTPNEHATFVDDILQKVGSAWPNPSKTLAAGVSSFGFGGTNCHVVMCEAPKKSKKSTSNENFSRPPVVIPVSHSNSSMLYQQQQAVAALVRSTDDTKLQSLSRSLLLRSQHQHFRYSAVGFSREELLSSLVKRSEQRRPLHKNKLCFVFSGQGPQWCGMGRRLLQKYPVFRDKVQLISDLFSATSKKLGSRFKSSCLISCLPGGIMDQFTCELEDSELNNTAISQPVLFALHLATIELLHSFGITPDCVIGHSLGEISAAVVSGSITLQSAVTLIYIRSVVMQKMTGNGSMISFDLNSPSDEKLLCAGTELDVASRNTNLNIVLSGCDVELEKAKKRADDNGIQYKQLKVDYAFHSRQMKAQAAELEREVTSEGSFGFPKYPNIDMFSTSMSKQMNPVTDIQYWSSQITSTVDFSSATALAAENGVTHFTEISPHPVLSKSIYENTSVSPMVTMHRDKDEERMFKVLLSTLHDQNYSVNWSAVFNDTSAPSHCKQPPQCYERQTRWVGSSTSFVVEKELFTWDE